VSALDGEDTGRLEALVVARLAAFGVTVEPGASPRVRGGAEVRYDDAAFFGRTMAHNFHGEVEVHVGEGPPLAWSHSWGRLPKSRTKDEVQADWEDMAFTGVLVGVLADPAVRERIPPDRRAEADAWREAERRRVLDRLERSLPDCDLAAFLREAAAQAPQ